MRGNPDPEAGPVGPAATLSESVRAGRSVPVYPVVFAMAWVISLFTDSSASWHTLLRPLIVCILVAFVVQIAITGILRNRHIGAIVTITLGAVLLGMAAVATGIAILLLLVLVAGVALRRSGVSTPGPMLTRLLNTISLITLPLVVATCVLSGAIFPTDPPTGGTVAKFEVPPPDIYLILLDGYPRSDTLAKEFGFDNGPFLESMRAMGFDVSPASRSNYNLTALTLASMFNAKAIADLPGTEDQPSVSEEYRALSRNINRGRMLSDLHASGYETISIPAGFSAASLYAVDRVIDSGNLNDFEYAVLQQGALSRILVDVQRQVLLDDHRDRIASTLAALSRLADERSDRPRFVFAHILSPHPPIVFGPNGEKRDGWPCFPNVCGIYTGGQGYGDAAKPPFRDQVAYLNELMLGTAERILTRSQRPPIVIFLSDHGSRIGYGDPDETVRSFFVASTPDHPDAFPQDVTPINLIPRLLNLYANAGIDLAPEKSYVAELRDVIAGGSLFKLSLWNAGGP